MDDIWIKPPQTKKKMNLQDFQGPALVAGRPALRNPEGAWTADPGAHGDVFAKPSIFGHPGGTVG